MKSYIDLIDETNRCHCPICPVESVIRLKQLRYLGHVQRMDDTHLSKIAWYGEVDSGVRSKAKGG